MKYKIMKFRMKLSYIAFEKELTIKELFFTTIMRSYMTLFKRGKIPISVEEVFRQQNCVYDKILALPCKECFTYIVSLNRIKDLQKFSEFIYIDQMTNKQKVFNYKQFLKDKGRQNKLEKITMLKKIMKQEGSSFYNVINFSKWVDEKEKPLQIYSESEKIVKKRIKSVKLDMYRKISLLYYIGALNKILFIKLRLKQIKLAKEIFILDIEEGIPVFLPSELK